MLCRVKVWCFICLFSMNFIILHAKRKTTEFEAFIEKMGYCYPPMVIPSLCYASTHQRFLAVELWKGCLLVALWSSSPEYHSCSCCW